jgi:peptidyl-prolyl cis-trans isomerase C
MSRNAATYPGDLRAKARAEKPWRGAVMSILKLPLFRSGLVALGLATAGAAGFAIAQTSAPPAPGGATAAAPSASKVVARVDGTAITEADLAVAADDPALSLPGVTDEQKRDLLVGYLIDLKIGAKAAESARVGEGADFARKLAYFRDKLLLDEHLEREVKKAVTPEAVRKLYEDTVKNVKPEQEVRARHILVETEDEAKKAQARLKAGEDFVKLAGELSKDPGSKGEGGDLGFFTEERMVQPFAETAFKLQPGQVSDPVKTQFGWHVIKVEEKRTRPIPAFDEMKEQVEQYLTRKTQQDLVLALREKAKIERLDQSPEQKR